MQSDLFANPVQFAIWLRQQKNMQGMCSCCGRFAKIYRRRLHATLARQLIDFYQIGGGDRYLHSSVIARGSGNSDFTIAKHWGLIYPDTGQQPLPEKKSAGRWRLSSEGIKFVLNGNSIAKYAYIYQDEVIGFSDETVTISQCLKEKGFDYNELMGK